MKNEPADDRARACPLERSRRAAGKEVRAEVKAVAAPRRGGLRIRGKTSPQQVGNTKPRAQTMADTGTASRDPRGGGARGCSRVPDPKISTPRRPAPARHSRTRPRDGRNDWEKACGTTASPQHRANNTGALVKMATRPSAHDKNPDLCVSTEGGCGGLGDRLREAGPACSTRTGEHRKFARQTFAKVRELADSCGVQPTNVDAREEAHRHAQWAPAPAVRGARREIAACKLRAEADAPSAVRRARRRSARADDHHQRAGADAAKLSRKSQAVRRGPRAVPQTPRSTSARQATAASRGERRKGRTTQSRIAHRLHRAGERGPQGASTTSFCSSTRRTARSSRQARSPRKIVRDYYTAQRKPEGRLHGKILTNLKKGDKAARAEAVEILSKPPAASDDVAGFKAVLLRELQQQTLKELAMLQINELSTATDQGKRKELNDVVEKTLEDLRRISPPRHPRVLGVEGWRTPRRRRRGGAGAGGGPRPDAPVLLRL